MFHRTDKKNMRRCDYKFKRYQYYWRPGYAEMLLKLTSHPRINLSFYSSMMRKTIVPTMYELLHDEERKLDALQQKVGIFDRDYNTEMSSLKYYDAIKEDPWDTYRDLTKVFADPYCK